MARLFRPFARFEKDISGEFRDFAENGPRLLAYGPIATLSGCRKDGNGLSFMLMQLTRTAFGMWSAGRFMHFGEPLDDDRFIALIHCAYDNGIRTFLTADVYGLGEADMLLGRALEGTPRNSYCLVGAI